MGVALSLLVSIQCMLFSLSHQIFWNDANNAAQSQQVFLPFSHLQFDWQACSSISVILLGRSLESLLLDRGLHGNDVERVWKEIRRTLPFACVSLSCTWQIALSVLRKACLKFLDMNPYTIGFTQLLKYDSTRRACRMCFRLPMCR